MIIPCSGIRQAKGLILAICAIKGTTSAKNYSAVSINKFAGLYLLVAQAPKINSQVHVLMQVPGLTITDCEALLNGLGSISNICSATTEELVELASLDESKAQQVVAFFTCHT